MSVWFCMTAAKIFTPLEPTPLGIKFRLAEAADQRALHATCYPDKPFAPFETMFTRSLRRQKNGRGLYLLSLKQDKIVGSAQLIHHGKRGELADIVVATAERGQGIGTALIRLLEQEATLRGWRPLEIGVESANGRALALYRRLGYQIKREILIHTGQTALILFKL
ncbi:MAG: GNAT family N-acetyltransferase [Anaerolineales bacterium]|nr:GNAT family N-acetyltransferase [Anaerolineales bacterium]